MSRSYLLVGIQFTLVVFIIWYGGVRGSALMVLGILIGLAAVATMRFQFSVLSEVSARQTFVTHGPYALVRHPMYTAVLLVTLGSVMNRPDAVSIIAWLALAVDLRLKLAYEERLLMARFSGYVAYMARTKRLIPWVY